MTKMRYLKNCKNCLLLWIRLGSKIAKSSTQKSEGPAPRPPRFYLKAALKFSIVNRYCTFVKLDSIFATSENAVSAKSGF